MKNKKNFVMIPLSDSDIVKNFEKFGFTRLSNNGSYACFINNKDLPASFNDRENLIYTDVLAL